MEKIYRLVFKCPLENCNELHVDKLTTRQAAVAVIDLLRHQARYIQLVDGVCALQMDMEIEENGELTLNMLQEVLSE